jgi:hypothetical protein
MSLVLGEFLVLFDTSSTCNMASLTACFPFAQQPAAHIKLAVPEMIRYHVFFSFLINFLASVFSFTFVPPPSCHSSCAATFSQTTRRSSLLQAVDNHDCENIIIVASIDGVVLDTRDLRIHQGIQAAVDTWPHLSDLVLGNDTSWILNKMKALAHCMTTHVGYSHSCDYAFLARLLLEEQLLDEGRSSGQKGKYASRFSSVNTQL